MNNLNFNSPSSNANPTVMLNDTVELLKTKVTSTVERAMKALREAIQQNAASPFEKHVDVLLTSSSLCRTIGGVIGILCKSGNSIVV